VVTRLADAALRLAVRRWPAELRADAAREWAAELYEIRHTPGSGGELRALRYATSLALARPPQRADVIPQPVLLRSAWRPVVLFLGIPLLCFLGIVLSGVNGPDWLLLVKQVFGPYAAMAALFGSWYLGKLLVCVALTATGLALGGHRRAGGATMPGRLAGICVASLYTGLAALIAALDDGQLARNLLPVLAVWAVLVLPALVQAARGAPVGRVLALGFGACYLAFTIGTWLQYGAAVAPRGYAPLWFPAALMPVGWIPLGPFDGPASSYVIWSTSAHVPQLLLAMTGLAVGYLAAASAPAPQPAPEPAAVPA
jgi:hypothetical protein